MNILLAWATGTLGGITASVLMLIALSYYRKVIAPYFENLSYKGVAIEGPWKAAVVYDDIGTSEEEWDLKQVAHKLKGIVKAVSGGDKGHSYHVEGEIRDGILLLTYSDQDRSFIDRGSITLYVSDNGTVLKGYQCYYVDNGKFKTVEYVCLRTPTLRDPV